MRRRRQSPSFCFVFVLHCVIWFFSTNDEFCRLNNGKERCSSFVSATTTATNNEFVNNTANNSSDIDSTTTDTNDNNNDDEEEEEMCDYLYDSCHGNDSSDKSSSSSSYPVIEYKGNSIIDKPKFIYGDPVNDIEVSSTYRVVEFYAPWCPHCQYYKDKYIKFANDLTYLIDQINNHNKNVTTATAATTQEQTSPQQYKVQVYAISCTMHEKVCDDEEIEAYPLIKVYKAGSNNATIFKSSNTYPAKVLKAFDIIKSNDHTYDEILNSFLEDNSSFHKMKKIPKKVASTFTSYLREFFTSGSGSNSDNGNNKQKVNDNKNNNNKPTRKEIYNDALLSFDYSMHQSIKYTNKQQQLQGDNNETAVGSITMMKNSRALRDWLETLSVTLPPMWLQAHSYIDAMKDNFRVIKTNKTFLHNDIIASYSPTYTAKTTKKTKSSPKWSSYCTKNINGMGYTCGLWELFHIMSLGVVEWNTNGVTKVSRILPTNDVGDILRNYIESFFNCDVCRKNFISDYDDCNYLDRCNRMTSWDDKNDDDNADEDLIDGRLMNKTMLIQFPLWLWEFHNAVNVRLYIEKVQREQQQQQQQEDEGGDGNSKNKTAILSSIDNDSIQNVLWPSKSDCPRCWYETNSINNINNKTKHNNSPLTTFNEDMVYKYLRVTYWPNDELNDQYKTELFGNNNTATATQPTTHNVKQQKQLRLTSSSRTITTSLMFQTSLPILCTVATAIICFIYIFSLRKVSSSFGTIGRKRRRRIVTSSSCKNNNNDENNNSDSSDNFNGEFKCCCCFVIRGKSCKIHSS